MYLTLQDPRAQVQGSRDPLGVLSVWIPFARHIISNLTTVTTSVRGFTILLLARYYTEKLVNDETITEDQALDVFLRMEQIGAYARHVGHGVEGDIRGIGRVKRNCAEHGSRVPIQADTTSMILSDQKTYGLWGLYRATAYKSGLLADGPVGITALARDLVEDVYLPRLKRVEGDLVRLLVKGGWLNTSKRHSLFKALSAVLPETLNSDEKAFYAMTLRDASRVHDAVSGRQARFAQLVLDHTELDGPIGRAEALTIAEKAKPEDEGLATRLEKIADLEAFLAPAEIMFGFIQTRNKAKPGDVARNLTEVWGKAIPNLSASKLQGLMPEITDCVGPETAREMERCYNALADGDYEEALLAEFEVNKLVMERRKSGPWVALSPDGRVDIRYKGAESELPKREELDTLWVNNYFIDALKSIMRTLERTN